MVWTLTTTNRIFFSVHVIKYIYIFTVFLDHSWRTWPTRSSGVTELLHQQNLILQEHIQWPLKSMRITRLASKDTARGLNKLQKDHPANKEDSLMTSKLLPQTSFPTAKGKDWSKGDTDSGHSGLLAGGVGHDHAQHSPSVWQGAFRGTFCTKASHGKQRSRSSMLAAWQLGHHGSQTWAVAGTLRHEGLYRHRGRQSLFWRARAYFLIIFLT